MFSTLNRWLLSLTIVLLIALLAGCPPKKPVVDVPHTLPPVTAATFGLSSSYEVSPYPVDNFGVFTAYQPPAGTNWDESNEICATWSCLGVDAKNVPDDPVQRISIEGFADTGSGGDVTLTDDQQKSFGVNLLLPGLYKLIDVGGKVDWKKNVTVKVQFGKTTKRVLNRVKAINYLRNTLQQGNPLKDAFDKGQLVLIVSDYVTDSLDATINVDKDLNAGANAALSKAAQTQLLPVGKDSSLKGTLENKGGGTYHLQVNNPVVIAVLPKQQPSGGTLGPFNPTDPWADFLPVSTPLRWRIQ